MQYRIVYCSLLKALFLLALLHLHLRVCELWQYKFVLFSSLKGCKIVQERSIFHRIWLRILKFRIWVLEIKHQKAHNFVWQGCFFFHYYLATSTTDWAQIFTGFFLCTCWNTPTVKTSLWQLPIVSTVFLRHNNSIKIEEWNKNNKPLL